MGIAYDIHDRWMDGYDFFDAVREVTSTGASLRQSADSYLKEFGCLQCGYTLSDFTYMDKREGRQQVPS